MIVVKRQKGDNNQNMISEFKKKVLEEGILIELRNRSRHVSESEKRKIKKSEKSHRIYLEKKRGN